MLPVGARTQWEVGNPPGPGTEVARPRASSRYEPADMTITVGAGTSFAALDAVLAEHGQECPLDPRDPAATVGGILACGLSGIRRLRHGPLRDHVLEVRFVTGDGRLVKGGGPTVKNVTGYDLPRLFVGSLGTLGVLVQADAALPAARRARALVRAPTTPIDRLPARRRMLWDGQRGARRCSRASPPTSTRSRPRPRPRATAAGAARPARTAAASRSPPGALRAIGRRARRGPGARWCAELGVGTVHVAADDATRARGARAVAHAHGGWLLREAGGARRSTASAARCRTRR